MLDLIIGCADTNKQGNAGSANCRQETEAELAKRAPALKLRFRSVVGGLATYDYDRKEKEEKEWHKKKEHLITSADILLY